MEIIEASGLMKYKDEAGNIYVLYPMTKKENIVDWGEGVDKGFLTEGANTAYTVTVPGIDALDVGVSFIMIPHVTSAAISPTLDVNGLGAKYVMQRISTNSAATANGSSANWLVASHPIRVTYNGIVWAAELVRADAASIYGTVSVAKGGTGGNTAEEARTNLGAAPATIVSTVDVADGDPSDYPEGTIYVVVE